MPRRSRQFIEGGIYHVYNRVASGEEIFSEPETAVGFLDCGARRNADTNSSECGQQTEGTRTVIRANADTLAVSS